MYNVIQCAIGNANANAFNMRAKYINALQTKIVFRQELRLMYEMIRTINIYDKLSFIMHSDYGAMH